MTADWLRCPSCDDADGVAGVVVRGVYDGALFWSCRECGARWHRWPEGHRLRELAERAAGAGGILPSGSPSAFPPSGSALGDPHA